MKSRTPVLLAVAIGCGLIAAFLANLLVKPGEEKVALVVATKEVPRGTLIKEAEEFFKLQEFPKESAPPTALRSLDACRHRVALRTVDAGQIASVRDVGEEDNFTRDLPKGHLALAVRTTLDSSVAGFVQPGARVDMICSLPHPSDTRLKYTKIFLRNVLVLAVNQHAARSPDAPPPNANPATVTGCQAGAGREDHLAQGFRAGDAGAAPARRSHRWRHARHGQSVRLAACAGVATGPDSLGGAATVTSAIEPGASDVGPGHLQRWATAADPAAQKACAGSEIGG
jgi:Flp pilus assembly protein CpaB